MTTGETDERPTRGGVPFWKSPAWMSAIAGLIAALAAVAALVSNSGGGGSASLAEVTEASIGTELELDVIRERADVVIALEAAATANDLPERGAYSGYTRLAASNGSVAAEVPNAWREGEVSNWLDDDDTPVGVGVFAAADDLGRVYNAWDTAGILTFVSDLPDASREPAKVIESSRDQNQESCVLVGGNEIDAGSTTGLYRIWAQCGTADSLLFQYATTSDRGLVTAVYAKLTTRADIGAVDRVLATLDVALPIRFLTEAEHPGEDIPGAPAA